MKRKESTGLSAADFFALSSGDTHAERLAAYDRALDRVDAEIALVKQAGSLEEAVAMLSPDTEELP